RIMRGESFQNIARTLFDQACRQTGATSGYVALLSDDGTENPVLFLEAGGLPCTVDPTLPMPIRGLREQAYATGRAVCENDFMNSRWVSMMPAGHVVLKNVLFAPLNIDGQTVGIMGLANKPTDFTSENLHTAEVIGDLAALALSHWRKSEALKKLADDYQTLFREMLDGFALHEIICDTAGTPVDYRFLAVNPAFERMTGLKAEGLIGRTVLEVMPTTEKHWISTYGRVALTGEPVHFHNVSGILGKVFEVTAFRPEPGKFACIFTDITAHQKAEQDLTSTRDFLENLINHANAPIIVWDPAFRITRFNQAFEQLTGHSAVEVIGKHISLLFPPDRVEASMRLIAKTLTGERWESVEIQILHASGTISTLLWNSATIVDPATKVPAATIAQGHDITIRLQKVQELRAAHSRLEALWSISSLADADVKKVSDHILKSLGSMTGSAYGFYGFVSPDEQVMTIHAWSGEAMKDCSMVTRPSRFDVCTSGIWAEAIRRREPLIVNDYEAAHPAKKGLPEGHVRLRNLLVVPFLSQDRITAVAAVANRPTDYTQDDISQITAFLNSIQALTESKRTEVALRESEERYRTVANFTYDWEYWLSPDFTFLYCSPACERITGYGAREFEQNPRLLIELIHPDDRPRVDHHFSPNVCEQVEHHTDEFRIVTKTGEIRWIGHVCQMVRDSTGSFRGRRASNRDITEQKLLHQQLLQAQKLESIGNLAGGVAHDFNNMLGVIIGRTENALAQTPHDSPVFHDLEEIMRSARHSAELTGQLLAFARKQSATPVVIDLNVVVQGTLRLLRRLIGENIRLDWNPASDVWPIKIDPGQIDQILTNLAINARDAIAGSGIIRLKTSNCTLKTAPSPLTGKFVPGDYVCFELSDNGCGMSQSIRERIFEPFFTTKELGKGTGLGL
ncbi:MAG TPA: PAS domain S-box protein, partial [Candidatus Ozemobacteraceae bacterium]|nr:PAS domain S-box protein [Candidatus Ozemobacteraceae bacterium]